MSAPRSNAGASSSRSENPDPQTNEVAKTYPKPLEETDKKVTLEWVERYGIVTSTDIEIRPRMFKLEPTGTDQSEWPLEKGPRKIHVQPSSILGSGVLAEGKVYKIYFQRPKGSPDTTPYTTGDIFPYNDTPP